jgi:hypothetical protein
VPVKDLFECGLIAGKYKLRKLFIRARDMLDNVLLRQMGSRDNGPILPGSGNAHAGFSKVQGPPLIKTTKASVRLQHGDLPCAASDKVKRFLEGLTSRFAEKFVAMSATGPFFTHHSPFTDHRSLFPFRSRSGSVPVSFRSRLERPSN